MTVPPFVIVVVVDGLRPDAITAEDTPTLFRLRTEGVEFTNGHSVFPTVTRVNAATIATGNFRNFLALDRVSGGRLVMGPTLGERLRSRGLTLAGVSSGSTGSSFLLNPRAPSGAGAVINGYFDPGQTVA